MLFPKISIRTMLILMVGVCLLAACMAGASRGSTVAFGVSVSVLATSVAFLMFAIFYWTALGLAVVWMGVVKNPIPNANVVPATLSGPGIIGTELQPDDLNASSDGVDSLDDVAIEAASQNTDADGEANV